MCISPLALALAYVAWRFWLGALNNKGGRGQRNREEIGAGAAWSFFLAASPLSRAPDKTATLRRLHSRPKRASHAGVSRELAFPPTPQARALALIAPTVQAKSRLSTNCLQYASSLMTFIFYSAFFRWYLGISFLPVRYCRFTDNG